MARIKPPSKTILFIGYSNHLYAVMEWFALKNKSSVQIVNGRHRVGDVEFVLMGREDKWRGFDPETTFWFEGVLLPPQVRSLDLFGYKTRYRRWDLEK